MKLNGKNLIKIVKAIVKESYGNLGPDDETEMDMFRHGPDENDLDDANRSREFERQESGEMNKEKFVRNHLLDWAHEFEAVDQGEVEIIEEILKDAYEEIAHALELDNTGLYE